MKLFIYSFIIILFISCSTENNIDNETSNLTTEKSIFIKNLDDEEKLITYKLLDNNEKYQLWQERYQEITNSDMFKKFNSEQTSFIKEMYSGLSPEHFLETSKDSDYFTIFLPKKRQVGLELFTQKQMNILFSNFDENSHFPKVYNSPNTTKGPHCGCSTSDDWCIGSASCFFWQCSTADVGCGWWLQEICNGFCATNGTGNQ